MSLWKKGESGNPAGRQPGQKTKVWALREAILKAVTALGDELTPEGGIDAFVKDLVRDVAQKDPASLLRALVSLIPREFKAQIGPDVEGIVRLVSEMDRVTAPGGSEEGVTPEAGEGESQSFPQSEAAA